MPRGARSRRHRLGALACAALLVARGASAKNPEQPETEPSPSARVTFLDHGGYEAWWFGAEANSIAQLHPSFAARYAGTHSLRSAEEA